MANSPLRNSMVWGGGILTNNKESFPWSIGSDVVDVQGVSKFRVDQHWLSLFRWSKAWGGVSILEDAYRLVPVVVQQVMKWWSLNFENEFMGAYVAVRVSNVLSPHLGMRSLEFFLSKTGRGHILSSSSFEGRLLGLTTVQVHYISLPSRMLLRQR